jgi:RND family efflux transporter MFP subunit
VEPTNLAEEIVLPGVVEAETTVKVSAEVAAVVDSRKASEGDVVRAGDVLLEFDKTELALSETQARAGVKALEQGLAELNKGAREQQVKEAEIGVEAAGSALEVSEKILRNREKLFQQKAITEEMLDQARLQVTQARSSRDRAQEMLALLKEGAQEETRKALEAQLEGARAAAEMASIRLGKAIVKSPIAGIVRHRFIEEHEFAGLGQALFEIMPQTPVKIVLGVPERIYTRLTEGDEVDLRVEGLGLGVMAKISRLDFAADQRTQTFAVEIRVDNPVSAQGAVPERRRKVLLQPGLIADIRFRLGVHSAVAVPSDAVTLQGTLFTVFVVENLQGNSGTVRAFPVEIGMKKEGVLEVTSGLASGAVLVIDGQRMLRDGDPVTVVQERRGPVAMLDLDPDSAARK